MIFDHRVYTARPGRMEPHMELFGRYGVDVYRRHVGDPVLIAMAESGGLNTYVHIWPYKDFAEREALREAIHHDPGWTELRREAQRHSNLVHQRNSVLLPAPFFDYKG